jgi:hypothetical protein
MGSRAQAAGSEGLTAYVASRSQGGTNTLKRETVPWRTLAQPC